MTSRMALISEQARHQASLKDSDTQHTNRLVSQRESRLADARGRSRFPIYRATVVSRFSRALFICMQRDAADARDDRAYSYTVTVHILYRTCVVLVCTKLARPTFYRLDSSTLSRIVRCARCSEQTQHISRRVHVFIYLNYQHCV